MREYKWIKVADEFNGKPSWTYRLTINGADTNREVFLLPKNEVWVAIIPADAMSKLPTRSYFYSSQDTAMEFCEKNYESSLPESERMEWSKKGRIVP